MQIKRINNVITLALLMMALAGCAANMTESNSTPRLDSTFGDAVKAARAQQTLNPDASQNTDPVAGIDGEAANSAVDQYEKSFKSPPATGNVFNIGVGSGGSGSSGSK
jgi:hypothetical protein